MKNPDLNRANKRRSDIKHSETKKNSLARWHLLNPLKSRALKQRAIEKKRKGTGVTRTLLGYHACAVCGASFYRKPSKKGLFCSKKCMGVGTRGARNPMYGHKYEQSTLTKMRLAKLGKRLSDEVRIRMSEAQRRPTTLARVPNRTTVEYHLWKSKVHDRDKFICQACGAGPLSGRNCHADHIKMWSEHPDLRFVVSNGRTLCAPCHKLRTSLDLRRSRLKVPGSD